MSVGEAVLSLRSLRLNTSAAAIAIAMVETINIRFRLPLNAFTTLSVYADWSSKNCFSRVLCLCGKGDFSIPDSNPVVIFV